MLDLNVFLSAINNALATLINEQTKPLVDRITALESQADEHVARIAVLEKLVGNRDALLKVLANRIAAWQDTQGEQMNDQTKTGLSVEYVKGIVAQEVHAAIEHHLENAPHLTEDEMDAIADNKLGDHCGDYDHDQFITEIDEDAVRHALRNATIRLG